MPSAENHYRYVHIGDNPRWPVNCRCNGTGKMFGGFSTCQWGYRAKTVDLLKELTDVRDGLREIEELDNANS